MRPQFMALLTLLVLVPTTVDAAECTDAEAAYADSVWAAAANTSACSPYVTQTNPVYVNAPCTATDCVSVVEGVAKNLPDCTSSGISNKIEVQNALTQCNGGDVKDAGSLQFSSTSSSSSQADTSTLPPSTASSSGLISGSKGSSSSCTTTEATDMWKLYVSIAESNECTGDAVVDGYSVNVLTQCDSSCAGKIKDLAGELPDCYFYYEHMDKKQDVQEQLDACNGTSRYVTISLYRDTNIDITSSSGSTIVPLQSSSGSGFLPSGDNPPNNILGSSTSRTGSSASGPRVHEGKLRLWVVSTLVAAIVAVYSN